MNQNAPEEVGKYKSTLTQELPFELWLRILLEIPNTSLHLGQHLVIVSRSKLIWNRVSLCECVSEIVFKHSAVSLHLIGWGLDVYIQCVSWQRARQWCFAHGLEDRLRSMSSPTVVVKGSTRPPLIAKCMRKKLIRLKNTMALLALISNGIIPSELSTNHHNCIIWDNHHAKGTLPRIIASSHGLYRCCF